jgi:hypothetical protein
MPEGYQAYLVSLLVKLGAMASIASVVARSSHFKASLMRETRTLKQRGALALWLAAVFGGSVTLQRIKLYRSALC